MSDEVSILFFLAFMLIACSFFLISAHIYFSHLRRK